MILSGELPAGSWLRLDSLADRLDMSHMPIREALRRMEALGLIELVPHKGARVRGLTRADFEDTHQTRLALEAIAVSGAAQRITPAQVAAGYAALELHESLLEAGDLDGRREAHTEFHFLLYRGSGSVWLSRAIEPVWQNSERYRFVTPRSQARSAQVHKEHVEILEACAAGDPERAVSALRRHLNGAAERILAQLPPA